MSHEPQQYPKWLYHATEPARVVADPDEHAALGPEWAETPAAFEPVREEIGTHSSFTGVRASEFVPALDAFDLETAGIEPDAVPVAAPPPAPKKRKR